MSRKQIIVGILFIAAVIFVLVSGVHEYLTFEKLKDNREHLKAFVSTHDLLSFLLFTALIMTTAFFVPGTIVLTVAGGFLFGVALGTLYAVTGATIGGALAFLLSRYVIGEWIQDRYEDMLKTFNREISRHGHHYLFTLRIVPILPFFLVNFFAGLTKMSLRTFIVTTSLGLLPALLVFTFAGQQLAEIHALNDIFSPKMWLAFCGLGLFALLPAIIRFMKHKRGEDSS